MESSRSRGKPRIRRSGLYVQHKEQSASRRMTSRILCIRRGQLQVDSDTQPRCACFCEGMCALSALAMPDAGGGLPPGL